MNEIQELKEKIKVGSKISLKKLKEITKSENNAKNNLIETQIEDRILFIKYKEVDERYFKNDDVLIEEVYEKEVSREMPLSKY